MATSRYAGRRPLEYDAPRLQTLISTEPSLSTSGLYYVENYGASTSAAAATNVTGIQAAIDAAEAAGGGIVQFGEGTYTINAQLTINSSYVHIAGRGMYTTQIHLDSATANGFVVSGSVTSISLRDFTLTCFDSGTNTRTAGVAITMSNVGNWYIANVTIRNGWQALVLSGASTGAVYNVSIDTTINNTLEYGVIVTDDSVANHFWRVDIAATGTCTAGILIDTGTDTCTWVASGVQATSATYGVRLDETGSSFSPRLVRFTDCFFEAGTTNISIVKGNDISFVDCYTKGGTRGVGIAGTPEGIRFIGGIICLSNQNGVLIDAGSEIHFSDTWIVDNSQTTDNTYDGVLIAAGVSNFSFSNCRIGTIDVLQQSITNDQKYGINIVAGASDYYRIVDCDLNNNQTGKLYDGGTGTNKTIRNHTTWSSRHAAGTVRTFTANDATPSVAAGNFFKTANANPTTVTMFDDGEAGQTIRVVINDAVTTIDFTGTNLKGNVGANWSPTTGDWLEATFDGTDWYCSVHDCTA